MSEWGLEGELTSSGRWAPRVDRGGSETSLSSRGRLPLMLPRPALDALIRRSRSIQLNMAERCCQ
jgi:hypothetical protein